MTVREIENTKKRLISGEPFRVFNRNYFFMQQKSRDGIYDYKIANEKGTHVGLAKEYNKSFLIAFSFGRFRIKIKEFNHVENFGG